MVGRVIYDVLHVGRTNLRLRGWAKFFFWINEMTRFRSCEIPRSRSYEMPRNWTYGVKRWHVLGVGHTVYNIRYGLGNQAASLVNLTTNGLLQLK